jgi:thiamine biosynthesis lipoprotein
MSGPVMSDLRFHTMGCDMRVLVEAGAASHDLAWSARRRLESIDARLSRFRPDSELARLNADPRPVVPASPLLRAAVRAALWAAERSGGLVDPMLLGDLEQAGYRHSLTGITRERLAEALEDAPTRAPARARGDSRWRAISVDDERGTIARPPGLRIDTGGSTKGLAADQVARVFKCTDPFRCTDPGRFAVGAQARRLRWFVDCGGDLRLDAGEGEAFGVRVEHPLTREVADVVEVRGGAIATSGPGRRLWRGADGRVGHHLLDPSTGAPAWTGLISATALAPTALEAETLAKVALLGGPRGARAALAEHGGVLVHDDGEVERVGPLAKPRLRVRATRDGLAVAA